MDQGLVPEEEGCNSSILLSIADIRQWAVDGDDRWPEMKAIKWKIITWYVVTVADWKLGMKVDWSKESGRVKKAESLLLLCLLCGWWKSKRLEES